MSEQDRKLLEAVRNWRPPTELHPIAMQTWAIYDQHGNTFPPPAVEALRKLLDGYRDDLKALAAAFEGLTRFVIVVSQFQKDEQTAQVIIELMRSYTPLFEPFWQRVGEALQNVGADTKEVLSAFEARDTAGEKVAPQFGQEAPKDTVPLREIAPPARPPAWAKKAGPSK
jgi:hypothetical protein